MPVDSVHSTIEPIVGKLTIWAPSEWPTIICNSRTSWFNCIEIGHSEFKNWKSFTNLLLTK